MIRVVYIAGPYINDVPGNTQKFKDASRDLWNAGFVAINPIANGDFMAGEFEEEVFRENGAILAENSHAVLMLPGWEHSKGANRERDRALKAGVPVFYNLSDIIAYSMKVDREGQEFKNDYICTFLATYSALHYDNACSMGQHDRLEKHYAIEDAKYLADRAWEKMKENVTNVGHDWCLCQSPRLVLGTSKQWMCKDCGKPKKDG